MPSASKPREEGSCCGISTQKWTVVKLVLTVTMGGLLLGYDTAVISAALIGLRARKDSYHGVEDDGLSNLQQAWLVTITSLGAIAGACLSGWLSDRLGRRCTLMISAMIFLVASIFMFYAPDYATLLFGRLAVGLAVGCCCMVVPVYIAETAPANLRGSLVTVNTVMIVFGQVVSTVINCPLARVMGGWRYMLGLGAIPALVMMVGLLFLPESPRWLVQKGRSEEASQVLHSVREELDETYTVQDEIQAIKKQMFESQDDGWSFQKLCHILSDVRIRSALAVGCVLHLAQQISGINTMMCYSANILQSGNGSADEENPLDPDAIEAICLSAITATANLIGNLVAMCFAERCGRRVLMLGSLLGACVSLFVLGFAFHTPDVNKLVVVASIMTFLFSYGCGLAPMPWTVNAEIYPVYARSICVSIATGVNWTINVIISLTFLDLGEVMSTYRWKHDLPMEDRDKEIKNHPDGVFWLYSVFTALCGIWLWFKMPETKGLTLEETIDQFDSQKQVLRQNAAAGDGVDEEKREGKKEEEQQDNEECANYGSCTAPSMRLKHGIHPQQ